MPEELTVHLVLLSFVASFATILLVSLSAAIIIEVRIRWDNHKAEKDKTK